MTALVSVCVGSIRATTVSHLIDSIRGQECPAWELIIVTQGQDSQLRRIVADASARDGRIRTLNLDKFGRSRALNAAVQHATSDIFAFTDDDCEAAPDWLSTILRTFERVPDAGIVAGDCVAPVPPKLAISMCPATRTVEATYRPSTTGFVGPPGFYWGGGNFAVRRSAMNRIGPFDEYLGAGSDFPGAEDVDFALRAEALDTVMVTTPRSVVFHSYGRRYGLRELLRYKRSSALGGGAVLAKLQLWDHRLGREWGRPRQAMAVITSAVRSPLRAILDEYTWRCRALGRRRYLDRFDLDRASLLSVPKRVPLSVTLELGRNGTAPGQT